MNDIPYIFKGRAKHDLSTIRKYTIKQWGKSQWEKYDAILLGEFKL